MPDFLAVYWSNNPNAPQIPYLAHFGEEATFVGDFIALILYGIIIVLLFQCLWALLIDRPRRRTRWALVAHMVAMFSLVTVATAMGCNLTSISYIDNREFNDPTSPGPLGYKSHLDSIIRTIPDSTFQLNQWLADGLLLYRCCIIYSMNYWAIVFPCLMYLASLVVGLMVLVWVVETGNRSAPVGVIAAYLSISLFLNVFLTLMIVTRLVLHRRQLQSALGATASAERVYKVLITLFVESCALYTIVFWVFLASAIANSGISGTSWPILNEIQVIATFLIIRRVVNQAFAHDTTPESISSIQFLSQRESSDSCTFLGASSTGSVERDGEVAGGREVGVETPSEESRCDSAQTALGNSLPNPPVF